MEFVVVFMCEKSEDRLLSAVFDKAGPLWSEDAWVECVCSGINTVRNPLQEKLVWFPEPFFKEHEARNGVFCIAVLVVVLSHDNAAVAFTKCAVYFTGCFEEHNTFFVSIVVKRREVCDGVCISISEKDDITIFKTRKCIDDNERLPCIPSKSALMGMVPKPFIVFIKILFGEPKVIIYPDFIRAEPRRIVYNFFGDTVVYRSSECNIYFSHYCMVLKKGAA